MEQLSANSPNHTVQQNNTTHITSEDKIILREQIWNIIILEKPGNLASKYIYSLLIIVKSDLANWTQFNWSGIYIKIIVLKSE